ncbi:preprotein translocase subunit SecE [Candidatus Saccharibacteria bacterium]|nr:preprotein translocase subunit SecE [Candidatus Saccharibacteria bacterium]
MANITRIKAGGGTKKATAEDSKSDRVVARVKSQNSAAATKSATKKAEKAAAKAEHDKKKSVEKRELEIARRKTDEDKAKPNRKIPAILKPLYFIATPFRLLGRYIKNSFAELRQVRWPNRKETWKLTGTVILYVVVVAVAIMLLDALLTFLFNKILGGN